MRIVTYNELTAFIAENEVVLGTAERPGLMLTPDNEIVKSFYRRKRFSTSTFIPQAMRFVRNGRKLLEKGIVGPVANDVIYCPEIPVHMVIYQKLAGDDLREMCAAGKIQCLVRLPEYLADLHDRGIFFRAIHLGNILFDGANMAIIDVSDLSTKNQPLNVFQRVRNFAHLLNSEDDKAYFASFGVHDFITAYLKAAALRGVRERIFTARLRSSLDEDVLHQMDLSTTTKSDLDH